MMHRLAYIELQGFRSWNNRARIEFPEKGLVLLRGFNRETGGGSGSGKTSLPLAINFALGDCDFPATELASWGSKFPMETELGFTDGAVFKRGKKLTVSVAGSLVEGSSDQKEEAIERYFGIDMEMVSALTYRGQRQPGLFLSKTDAEKKEFLTKLLGLDRFEQAIEKAAANVKVHLVTLAKKEAVVSTLGQSLAGLAIPEDVALLESQLVPIRVEADALLARSQQLKEQIEEAKRGTEGMEAAVRREYADEMMAATSLLRQREAVSAASVDDSEAKTHDKIAVQCVERAQRLVAEDQIRKTAVEKQRDGLQRTIREKTRAFGALTSLRSDRQRLIKELESMLTDICPTCERAWDRAQERRAKVQAAIAATENQILVADAAGAEAEELETQLAAVPVFQPNASIAKMRELQQKALSDAAAARQAAKSQQQLLDGGRLHAIAEARQALSDLKAKIESSVAEARAQGHLAIQECQNAATDVSGKWMVAHDDKRLLEGRIERAHHQKKNRAGVESQLAEAQVDVTAAQVALSSEEDFLALVGREGFLGSIFDEVLAEIGDEANELLASVANTRHCTVAFRSESLTQKGAVRREIRPVVTISGVEAPMRSGLSGGMYSVVELAVDLALGNVISRRTGVCPGWLILDESFDGLGPVEKESVLEILQHYAEDRLVLVIDHTSEFQSAFTRSIDVEFVGGESRLLKAA